VVAGTRNVFVSCWVRSPTRERLDWLIATQRTFAAAQPGRHAVISLIDPKTGREMDSATRKYAGELGATMDATTAARLFIVLADGFYAAMVRTAISGVLLFSKDSAPYHVATQHESGMQWLEKAMTDAHIGMDGVRVRALLHDVLSETDRIKSAVP